MGTGKVLGKKEEFPMGYSLGKKYFRYGKSLGEKRGISHGKFPWEKIIFGTGKVLSKKEEKYVNFPWEIPMGKNNFRYGKSLEQKRGKICQFPMGNSHGKK